MTDRIVLRLTRIHGNEMLRGNGNPFLIYVVENGCHFACVEASIVFHFRSGSINQTFAEQLDDLAVFLEVIAAFFELERVRAPTEDFKNALGWRCIHAA